MSSFKFVSIKGLKFVKTSGKTVNRTDLSQIQLNASNYRSVLAFHTDISWVVHNVNVVHPSKDEMIRAASELIPFVNEEIASILHCNQCYNNAYLNPKNSFVMPCDTPHQIIWAKMEGFNFWPAKAMSANREMVHVRFFGDHTTGDVQISSCFEYSKNSPDESQVSSTETYNKALKVS